MREDVAAKIGNDALAQRGDEVVARGTGESEQCGDPDHDQEIAVDQVQAAVGEPEIDHAPDRDGHDQRGHGGKRERSQGQQRATAITADIGKQRSQRPNAGPAVLRRARSIDGGMLDRRQWPGDTLDLNGLGRGRPI